MCLATISRSLKKEIDRLKVNSRGYITLWKVFGLRGKYLVADCQTFTFYEGKNTARGGNLSNDKFFPYPAGFHCFTTEESAAGWNRGDMFGHIQKIKTRKNWITSVGTQGRRKVVVCKHIII